MDIQAISTTSTPPLRGTSQEESNDFETFLKMLTTQIQNQDPLSPMEADQFASQLASFSMVEQQTLTNQNLQAVMSFFESGLMANVTGMVGKTALHTGPFAYSGNGISFDFGQSPWNDGTYKLTILDEAGARIADVPVAQDQTAVSWDGGALNGTAAPFGTYTAEIRSVSDDAPLGVQVYTGDVIQEVQFSDDGALLVLANGATLRQEDVTRLR